MDKVTGDKVPQEEQADTCTGDSQIGPNGFDGETFDVS
jgi:hypothetical protein